MQPINPVNNDKVEVVVEHEAPERRAPSTAYPRSLIIMRVVFAIFCMSLILVERNELILLRQYPSPASRFLVMPGTPISFGYYFYAISLIVAAFAGMVGAFKSNRTILTLLSIYLMICCSISGSQLLTQSDSDTNFDNMLIRMKAMLLDIKIYDWDISMKADAMVRRNVDSMQSLGCCGSANATEWIRSPFNRQIRSEMMTSLNFYPPSCCASPEILGEVKFCRQPFDLGCTWLFRKIWYEFMAYHLYSILYLCCIAFQSLSLAFALPKKSDEHIGE